MSDSNQAKRGPKSQHWTDSRTGKLVEGLTKQKDGRWRILGTATQFTEPNEQKAIAKFRRITFETLPVPPSWIWLGQQHWHSQNLSHSSRTVGSICIGSSGPSFGMCAGPAR